MIHPKKTRSVPELLREDTRLETAAYVPGVGETDVKGFSRPYISLLRTEQELQILLVLLQEHIGW